MIGQVLGKYRIEAELSRGGMGAVYRARHTIIDRDVALKLLRTDLTSNPELVTRFVNEARAASAIRHPGIIELFDFGTTDDGQAYLVMELLEGETLKPDNVFLVPDPDVGERPKVLDFGVARLTEGEPSQTRTGALMGTPLYMAPEQARSADLSDALAAALGPGDVRPRTAGPAVRAAVPPPTLVTGRPRSRNVLPLAAAGITLAIAGTIAAAVVLGGRHDTAPPVSRPAPMAPSAPPPSVPVTAPAPAAAAPAPPDPAPVPAPARPRPVPKRPSGKKSLPTTDKGAPVETSI